MIYRHFSHDFIYSLLIVKPSKNKRYGMCQPRTVVQHAHAGTSKSAAIAARLRAAAVSG